LRYFFLMTSRSSERTPLLRSVSPNPQNGSAVTEDEVTAAEVAQQGEGGALQFPKSKRMGSLKVWVCGSSDVCLEVFCLATL
jgi:hypothetical protein